MTSSSARLLLLTALSLRLLVAAQASPQRTIRLLKAAAPESVSIYDGVLPSPDLGPRRPQEAVPAPAPEETVLLTSVSTSQKMSCSAGCIAGSVVGGTVGIVLLLCVIVYYCCWWRSSVKDDSLSTLGPTTSNLELLGHPDLVGQDSSSMKTFRVGDEVFCKRGRNCTYGRIVSQGKDDSYTVSLYTGEQATFRGDQMAPNFAEFTEVWYTPPDGRPSMTGTILQADGSYWPPFYQLRPHEGDVDLVNTTADCLSEATKGTPAHYIMAKAV